MRPVALLTTVALAFGLIADVRAEPLRSTIVDGMPHWHWQAPASQVPVVRIDLIRADVTIVAAPSGIVTIDLHATGPRDSAERLWIDATSAGGAVVISDRFPQRSPWSFDPECLPPPDARGDFWLIANRLKVTIGVPAGVSPIVAVRDGPVRDQRSARLRG